MDTSKKEVKKEKRTWFRVRLAILMTLALSLLLTYLSPSIQRTIRNTVMSRLCRTSEVELSGSGAEMGRQHGESSSFSIKLLNNLYVKKIICRGDKEKHLAASEEASAIFAKIDSRWTEEIDAVALAADVDAKSLMLGNTFLDQGLNSVGCRQVIVSRDDGVLHAHNMDWDNLGGVGNFLVTIFRTEASKNRLALVYIAFPGMIGALDVINEKGLALSFNQIGFGDGKCDMPVFIAMRQIAESCGTFKEASEKLRNMPRGMAFCIGLSDSKTGQAAVFERETGGGVKFREIRDGILTADNSTWCGTEMKGRCSVDDVARAIRPDSLDKMKRVLRDEKVLLSCNIYSVIFDYARNSLYLAVGGVPAANGEYKEFSLFSKKDNARSQ